MKLWLPREIEEAWPALSLTLAPAVQVDPKRTVQNVFYELLQGTLALFTINENEVNALVVVAMAEIDGVKRLSLIYLAGTINAPPRQWIKKVRDLMQIAISVAKDNLCTELRIEGRDWSRVFPEWERMGSELRLEI